MKHNNIIIGAALMFVSATLATTSCSNEPDYGTPAEEVILASGITMNVGRDLPLAVGMTKKVEARINNIDSVKVKTIVWSSTDESVATVTQDGEIKALKAGATKINLTQKGSTNPTAYIQVTVMPAATAISMEPVELYEGTVSAITPVMTPSDAYNVLVWSSSDESVAKVDSVGNVTGVKPGTATITAKTTDGTNLTASAAVTVKKVIAIESMSLIDPGYAFKPGEKARIECSLQPADASVQLLEWTSSNEKVATVDKNGVVKAIATGTVDITAKDPLSGKEDKVSLTVANVASWNLANYTNWNDLVDEGWSVGNGATYELANGYLHVLTKDQGGKYRGDITFVNDKNKLALDAQTYRYLAIAMDPPGVKGKRSIKLDFSGTNGSGDYGAEPTEFVTGKTQVACWDLLSKGKNPSGELKTLQIKMADIKAEPYFYNIYWIHTFKTMDELNAFVGKHWK